MSPLVLWIIIAIIVIVIVILLIVFLTKRKKSGYAVLPQCIITGNNLCQHVGQGKECSGNGKMMNGKCECEIGWYGNDCKEATVNWYQWLVDNIAQLQYHLLQSENYNQNPSVFIWKLSNQLTSNYQIPLNVPQFILSTIVPLINSTTLNGMTAPVKCANENIISAVIPNPTFTIDVKQSAPLPFINPNIDNRWDYPKVKELVATKPEDFYRNQPRRSRHSKNDPWLENDYQRQYESLLML